MEYLQHNPKTVALVCMGPSVCDYLTQTLTQEFKPDFADEVWVINMSANCFRHDVVFWMDDLQKQHEFRPGLIEQLRRNGKPVITSIRRPELVPTSYDYPIEEICLMPMGYRGESVIDFYGKPYLNNGVAMAIAYALWKRVSVMKIFGADFSYPNRDFAESGRACVEAWITFAMVQGMTVGLCDNTSIMDNVKDHGVYGYYEQPEIRLRDGRVFKYVKLDQAQVGKYQQQLQNHDSIVKNGGGTGYVPEDTSGVTHADVSGVVPGVESRKSIARPNGAGAELPQA